MAETTRPVDLHEPPTIVAVRRYTLAGVTSDDLGTLRDATLCLNSQRWRGYRRGTIKVTSFNLEIPPGSELAEGELTLIEYDRPFRRVRADRKYVGLYHTTDFNALPIGDEIKDDR